MHRNERLFLYGGVCAALAFSLAGPRFLDQPAFAQEGAAATPVRVATLDMYSVTKALMERPEMDDKRDAIVQANALEQQKFRTEMSQMEAELQILPTTDRKYRETVNAMQARQQAFQKRSSELNAQLEELSAKQLSETFATTKVAAKTVADKAGYTHVCSTRGFDLKVEAGNLTAAVQELLARPVLIGPPADDITNAVLQELQLPVK